MASEGFKRKLTAILSADVEGYSRLMGEDEEATVRTLTAYREVLAILIQQHNGQVLDSQGDNLLAEFASVVDAVQCSVAVQKEIKSRNDELPENRRMQFRIGINLGDVIQEEGRIYGDGVNIAARLEGLAEPGGICISKTAFDHIESKLPYGYEFLGDQTVKNIAKPVGAYRVMLEPRVTIAEEKEAAEVIPFWRRKATIAAAIAVVVVIIGVAVWNFYLRPPPIEPASVERMAYPLPDKPSIAVLPFENLSGDPNQEYFSDGLTDQIITALSNVNNMFVIARNSTFTYKGKPVKVKQVAEELGVRYVLEGSIRKAGDRVRITAQLIDAMTGHHLWAERYDRQPKDIFDVQDEITKKIIIALQVELTEGEQARVYAKATDNFEAYEKFLRGMEYFFRFNKGDNFLARQAAAEAIALDPEFATAYTLLGFTHLLDVNWSKSPRSSMEQALQAAQRALALDESFPPTHNLLCAIYLKQRQWEKAIAEGKRAIALNPNYARGHMSLADTMLYAGRFEEAIEHAKKAIQLNPYYHPRYLATLGRSYQMAGYHEEALRVYKEYRVRCEKWKCPPWWGRLMLASTYIELGQEDEARAHIAEVLRARPDYSLEKYAKTIPFKDPAHSKRILDALQKAGLPDGTSSLPLPDRPSIAVLPFANMSGDETQEYISDGITESIITALSKVPSLFVIARNSSFTYKGKPAKDQQVSQELGVRYVLEGSVQKSGEKGDVLYICTFVLK